MGQLQDTMYKENSVVIRDVSSSQFAILSGSPPQHPGIRYRVDGVSEYCWNGSSWISFVSSSEAAVSGDIEIRTGDQLIVIGSVAPSDADGRPDGTIYIQKG